MTSDLEKLLAPVSAENECGEDISYDPAYQEIEKLLLGKPETQFSAAEPPNWSQIREQSIALLGRSKHLRLAIILSAALMRVEGFAGFRDGIAFLKSLVEKYWQNLFPRLDPEDNNDPTERVNIVASLAAPLRTFGDPFKILEALRLLPLCDSRQHGRFCFEDISNSRAGVASTKQKRVPTAADIDAAFRDTNPATIQASSASVSESLALAKGLQQALDDSVGSEKGADFAPLLATLTEIKKQLAGYLPAMAVLGDAPADQPAESVPDSAEPVEAAGRRETTARNSLAGSVENRQQVVQALDLVCSYYSRYEPSSPVPLLLQRARRLVELDFLGIVAELTPEALDKMRAVAGIPKDNAKPAA